MSDPNYPPNQSVFSKLSHGEIPSSLRICYDPDCTWAACIAARNHATDDPNTFRVCHDPNCAYGPCVRAKEEARKEEVWSRNWRQKVSELEKQLRASQLANCDLAEQNADLLQLRVAYNHLCEKRDLLEATLQESREKRDKLNDECNKLDRENRGLKKCNKSLIDRNDFLFGQLSASQSNHKKACEQSKLLAVDEQKAREHNLKLIQERDNWKKDAELRSRNESWLRGLLEAIGGYFGKAARTDNTGIDTGEIFVSKLPDLVRDLFATHKVDPRVAQLEVKLKDQSKIFTELQTRFFTLNGEIRNALDKSIKS